MVVGLPPAETVQVLSTAETFQAWATGVVAIATTVAILVGGGWALWRYILPGPFGCAWVWEAPYCSVRVLPSGRYLYLFEVRVRNASSALYTMRRLTLGIYFPDEELDVDEILRKKLTPPFAAEVESNLRCPPHTQRSIRANSRETDTLYHVVVVAWRAEYHSRRLLGLLGRCDEAAEVGWVVPVDAQSLALYAAAEKERQRRQTAGPQ